MNHESVPFLFTEELYQVPQAVIIILARKWEAYSADDKALLTKILSSVRLSMASVQVLSQSSLSLPSILSFGPSKVVIFGAESSELNYYEAVQAQGFTVLKADDLSELDDAKKKTLWLGLKNMFSV